jgi:ribosomal protein S18 acetylase RimI-like enzyme
LRTPAETPVFLFGTPRGAKMLKGRDMLTVRSAVATDESAVAELWRACGLVMPYNDPASDFRFAKAGPASDVLVGVDEGGEVIGSVMVGHDGHRGWLYYVAASPDRQGKGIGRQMVRSGEEWLRARGVVKVQLLVRQTNTKVVGFYESLGYEETPRVLMSRWL